MNMAICDLCVLKVYKNGRNQKKRFSLLEVIISHKDIINFLNKHMSSLKKDVGMNASTAPKRYL